MLKHLYVEIDATEAQKQQLEPIVKQAAKDLLPLREQLHAGRREAIELLSQERVDPAALEALRAKHIALADEASRRHSARSSPRTSPAATDAASRGYSRSAVGRVLLIEDDARLAAMLTEYLGGAGYRVTLAPSGAAGLERLAREPYDALVLDLSLPDIDGLEVCRRLRARWELPVLMLTARGEAMDRIVGLEIGADDYLPKPFEPRELLARLKALLRRANRQV